jgi:AAA domain
VRAALAAHPDLFPGAGDRLTTRAALRLEAANLDLMRQARAERRPPIVPAPWQAPDLGPDQLRVARHILESQAQLLAVEGKPGTGKTFTLARVREVAAARGWTVRGFAVTTGAVEELRKVGIDAATVKSLEHQPLPPGSPGAGRQLWIVDEAGLLSNRDAGTLLARARLADARAVLVGDRRQHHAVAAGKPFVDLQQAGLEAVRLDSIRRQRHPEILAAVRLTAEGRAAQAVDHLARHGHVTEIRAARDRHQAMARAFVAAPPGTLMIAPSHAERTALNALARRLLLAEGRVASAGVTVEVAVSKSLTGAQRSDVRSYQPSDLVTFHRGSPTRRLRAGEAARVVAVDPDRHLVTVERLRPAGGAATLEYDPRRLRGVDVAQVERRELAAGDRIVFRQPYRSARVANGAAAQVLRVEPGGALEIELDRRPGRPVLLDHRAAPLPLDHGYAVTSHAAQGRTVHTVLATIDVEHSPELVNRQQLHVTISRPTHGLHIFTNDRAALPAAVHREAPKTSARELLPTERSPARAPGQGLDPARAPVQPAGPAGHAGRHRPEPAAAVRRDAPRERAAARGTGAADRRRTDRPLLARAADPHRRPGPELRPGRRAFRPPDPPRDPGRGPARGAGGGGRRGPGDPPDPGRHGAEDRFPRGAAGPVPARLKERLEAAWARWQSWRAERDAVARDAQALRVELARLRAPAAHPGSAASAIPALAARLAVLKSRLAALTRARAARRLLDTAEDQQISTVGSGPAFLKLRDGVVVLEVPQEEGTIAIGLQQLMVLSADREARLQVFHELRDQLGPTCPDLTSMRQAAELGPLSDAETNELFSVFGTAVQPCQARLSELLAAHTWTLDDLVPSSYEYFEGFCGPSPGDTDAETCLTATLPEYRKQLLQRDPAEGLRISLLGALRDDLCPGQWLGDLSDHVVWTSLQACQPEADPLSLLAGLDVALHRPHDPRFAEFADRAVAALLSDHFPAPNEIDFYRLFPLLAALVLEEITFLEDGTRRPPFWRRLCAWMQALLVIRQIPAGSINLGALTEAIEANLSSAGRCAKLVDLRQEPMYHPGQLSARGLRLEVLGRLRRLALRHQAAGRYVPQADQIEQALERFVAGGSPFSWIPPGPLEGHRSPVDAVPEALHTELSTTVAEELPAALLACSRLFRLTEELRSRLSASIAVDTTPDLDPRRQLARLEYAGLVAAAECDRELADAIAAVAARLASSVQDAADAGTLFKCLLVAAAAVKDEPEWGDWLKVRCADVGARLPAGRAASVYWHWLQQLKQVTRLQLGIERQAEAVASAGTF